MKKGTRSLLFGVHQFIWHPITVLLAWKKLYGCRPSLQEAACIFVHDWGYWGCEDMDEGKGIRHPAFGAWMMRKAFKSRTMQNMVLFHSRHYAKRHGAIPSPLCWADKLSLSYERWWTYIPRAWLSGELREYRLLSAKHGMPLGASNREWFSWIQDEYQRAADYQQPGAPRCLEKPAA